MAIKEHEPGTRSIYRDGWRAVCPVPGPSLADGTGWELYNLADDIAGPRNLAAAHRDRLIEMIALWYVEAGTYKALPHLHVYYPGTSAVSNVVAPRTLNGPHSITATVQLPRGAEGVLVAQGGASGGYALYIKNRRLHYAYNFLGVLQFHVSTDAKLAEGRHELRLEFEPTGEPDLAPGKGTPARAQLYVDGKLAGQGDLPITVPLLFGLGDGLSCGRDGDTAVTTDYSAPFAFTGTLEKVVVDVAATDGLEPSTALFDGATV